MTNPQPQPKVTTVVAVLVQAPFYLLPFNVSTA